MHPPRHRRRPHHLLQPLQPLRRLWPSAMVALCLLQSGCAVPVATPMVQFEHYDPRHLNHEAVTAYAAGDHRTARILLERASVLAPADRTVQFNLGVLQSGGGSMRRTGPPVASAASNESAVEAASPRATAGAAAVGAADNAVGNATSAGPGTLPDIGIWPLK